ncbi:MAG: hypothetical protein CMP14_09725 [Rickettsiales bacterium]|jgi:hypothetical protein|nr:hypothetical protein [Rickettsiales bacterium]
MTEAKKSSSSDSKKSSASSDSSASSSSSSNGGGGKSQRDSIGGSKEVHYGYFSSVRTPEYRNGWEAIWGKKSKKSSGGKAKKSTGPVELNFEFDTLPENLQEALMEHARKKLRRTPKGFKKLQEMNAIDWSLSVRIDP